MAKFVPFFLLALAVLAAAHPLISPDESLCEDESLPGKRPQAVQLRMGQYIIVLVCMLMRRGAMDLCQLQP